MNKQPIHTSTACNACVPPGRGPKLALSDVLVRWLADLDAGKFKYPHVLVDDLILTRVGSIWEHCLLQEWFINTAMVTTKIDFKRYLLDHGIVGGKTFEKTIDGVRHTGFVSVKRRAINGGMQENVVESAPARIDGGSKNTPDSIGALIQQYEQLREDNQYCYFELACTRYTDWMAWICSNQREEDPNRKVLAKGQGATPEEACANALAALGVPA